MEIIGETNGIKVIDDYAHNPKKIQAAIDTARLISERLIVVFQPHGYGPTEFLKDELISTFAKTLSPADTLYMPEIFYAGGTAQKRISSNDIIKEKKGKNLNAFFVPEREDLVTEIKQSVTTNDTVLVMGARDDSLTYLCQAIIILIFLHTLNKNYLRKLALYQLFIFSVFNKNDKTRNINFD